MMIFYHRYTRSFSTGKRCYGLMVDSHYLSHKTVHKKHCSFGFASLFAGCAGIYIMCHTIGVLFVQEAAFPGNTI